jgi:exodeoxyribonuclease V alpha subunit
MNTTGIILETYAWKNNTYCYRIKTNNGKLDSFIKYNGPLETTLNEVTINYDVCNSKIYGKQNIIKSVAYGNFVQDIDIIKTFLKKTMELTDKFISKLIDQYSENTLHVVFKETDKISRDIKHPKLSNLIDKIEEFKKDFSSIELKLFLTNLNIPTRFHDHILKEYSTEYLIRSNIYKFGTFGISFEIYDQVALKFGYDKNCYERLEAFRNVLFDKYEKDGILYVKSDKLLQKCNDYDISLDPFLKILDQIQINDGIYYTTPEITKIEKKVQQFFTDQSHVKFPSRNIQIFDDRINSKQRQAVQFSLDFGISVITGPPGSGKTTTIKEILFNLSHNSLTFIMAYTGNVVEKIKNDLQSKNIPLMSFYREVCTIHSFVHFKIDNGVYKKKYDPRNEKMVNDNIVIDTYINDNDIPYGSVSLQQYDEITLIIDEVSMVDLRLMNLVAHKMKDFKKSRIIMLGDADQLPSMGGGNLLTDLIQSQIIPVTKLVSSYRQNNNSLLDNALNIRNGIDLNPDGDSVIYKQLSTNNDSLIKHELIGIIEQFNLTKENSCVLSPMNKGSYGVIKLNNILQEYYNLDGQILYNNGKHKFKQSDILMHTKNDYDKRIYNGSKLIITESCKKMVDDKEIDIYKCLYTDYTGKTYTIEFDNTTIHDLKLAYSMTIHKSQGKEYDTVIIFIPNFDNRLLTRNLLYTALTRAKNRCIIIGSNSGLKFCKRLMTPRVTGLFLSNRLFSSNNHHVLMCNKFIIASISLDVLIKKSYIKSLFKALNYSDHYLKDRKSFLKILVKNDDLLDILYWYAMRFACH